ncbi:Folate-binding aminomethyltransferase-like protein [Novymonas esmeraldas]|uniref:Folate-binding aminomethyltransferase-like protein n=1 Tax=Novymonas esmeraldas TaxID=1808958 RepID=A0AAW0EYU0_9TRYP
MKGLTPFVTRLSSRRILRVRGVDAHDFLQGMFTNDLRELHPAGSLYGCFLYFTGRVLCDAHLYQCRLVHDGQSSILVDVHESSVALLLDHLVEMKMRKKVQIDDAGKELVVLAALEEHTPTPLADAASPCSNGRDDGRCIGSATEATKASLEERHTECFVDARNAVLFPPQPQQSPSSATSETEDAATATISAPLLSPPPTPAAGAAVATTPWLLRRCVVPATWAPPPSSDDAYTTLLHSRGIGEGPAVFRANKSLPFEGNIDFLGGVSFHKGCYVGQELTHRTHVMLVTRKRVVPLVFGPAAAATADTTADITGTRPVAAGESLYSAAKERIGEVMDVCGSAGVGLLRLRYVDKASRTVPGLQLKDGTPVSAHLPDWWPRKEVKKLLKNND